MRQVVAAIYRRQTWQLRARGALAEWHAKTVATVIAATVPIEKGKKNPLLAYVDSIHLYPDSETAQPGGVDVPEGADPEAVAAYGFDPEHPNIPESDVGSFERAVTQLGGPPRR